jgi:hypothetical protein
MEWIMINYQLLHEPYMMNDSLKNDILTWIGKLKNKERINDSSDDMQDYLQWKKIQLEKIEREKEETINLTEAMNPVQDMIAMKKGGSEKIV